MKTLAALACALGSAILFTACAEDVQAMDAQQIEQKYGVAGGYADTVATADGPIKGTVVPITLANGRSAQLFIPQKPGPTDPHAVYLKDEQGLHPVVLSDNASRDDVARAPEIVTATPEPAHVNKRSWEKEVLIIGGSAGVGTAIGAAAGGKKGAAVGAVAGGVGGLIYDLLTRNKKQ